MRPEDTDALISAYLDNALSEEELRELDDRIRATPAVADLFCELAVQHALLHKMFAAAACAAASRASMGPAGRVRTWASAAAARFAGACEALAGSVLEGRHPGRPAGWAGSDAHGSAFMVPLRRRLQGSCWYAASVGLHAVAVVWLFLIPVQPPPARSAPFVVKVEEVESVSEADEPGTSLLESTEPRSTDEPVSALLTLDVTTGLEIPDQSRADHDLDRVSLVERPGALSKLVALEAFGGMRAPRGLPGRRWTGRPGPFGLRSGAGRRLALSAGGGSPRTEKAVRMALRWLATAQEADGHWGGAEQAQKHPVAVSSLALLALLGSGNTPRHGRYCAQVRRAAAWLQSQQKASGCIGPHRYEAALALMALAETYGMARTPALGAAAQRAVDWAVRSQGEAGGWDYEPGGGLRERVDSSVTGWWIMALKSARSAGLRVPPSALHKALAYCRQAVSPPQGSHQLTCTMSYASRGGLSQVRRGRASSSCAGASRAT